MVSMNAISKHTNMPNSAAGRFLAALADVIGWVRWFMATFAKARSEVYKIAGDRFVCWED